MDNVELGWTFAVPIIKIRNAYKVSKQELKFIRSVPTQKRDKETDTVTSKSNSVLDNKELKNLRDVIDKASKIFINEVYCVSNEFQMVQSWVAKSKNKHSKHIHQNAMFSVVYYAKADDAEFRIDRTNNIITEGFNFSLNYNKLNPFNSTQWTYKVKTGDIIIIPGHISHEGINKKQNEKIVVGGNYFIKGRIGNDKSVTSLII